MEVALLHGSIEIFTSSIQGQDALISALEGDSRFQKRSGDMSDLYWLSDAQMAKLAPFFPKSHGKPRVDDKRVLSGIIFINRNGLRWRDAPDAYGPHKTLYSGWKRWSEKGIFARMLLELADQGGETDTVMIDATHLKTHRTASSLGLKKGGVAV
jgi:transposase